MHQTDLSRLGWNDERAAEYTQLLNTRIKKSSQNREPLPGRVVGVHHELFDVLTSKGVKLCSPSGSFRQNAELWPTVGDWVVLTPVDLDGGVVTDILSREEVLSRGAAGNETREQVIAANVDYIFIVSGLDHDFNPRRIERYVTLSWNSGATPVVVLNKADLVGDAEEYLLQVGEAAPGVDVVLTSALQGTGVENLQQRLQDGSTAVLVGSSGCGKSTLTNAILGREIQATQEVRSDDQRGRHTTSDRRLFLLPDGGCLIDSPGLREVGLWGDTEGVDEGFREIALLSEQCRFKDCSHQHEPGCAVLEALEQGEISQERYSAYLKQMRELEYLQDRQAAQRRKQEWHKSISKEIRKFYKERK